MITVGPTKRSGFGGIKALRSYFVTPSLRFVIQANSATAATLLVNVGIFRRKLMSSFAVGLCTALGPRLFRNLALDWFVEFVWGHNLGWRETLRRPVSDRGGFDADLTSNIGCSNLDAINLNPYRPMGGFLLFFSGGPSKIIGSVRAIIVNAINSVTFGRPFSDVLYEKPEIMPSPAYRDAPSAIPMVLGGIGLIAAGQHVSPSLVKRMVFLVHSATLNQNTVIVNGAS